MYVWAILMILVDNRGHLIKKMFYFRFRYVCQFKLYYIKIEHVIKLSFLVFKL